MLALCRQRAEQEGLAPRLYEQAMHTLDLPRRYRTIYICDSFGLGGQRQQDAEALRQCHRHLVPGGTLVFSHGDAKPWPSRPQLPEPWPATGTRRQASNGDEYELRSRLVAFDPLEQRLTRQIRASLLRAGQVVAEEEHTLQQSLYVRNEVLRLLAQAGFGEVAVRGGYTEAAATADDTMLVFVARA